MCSNMTKGPKSYSFPKWYNGKTVGIISQAVETWNEERIEIKRPSIKQKKTAYDKVEIL